MRVIIDVFRIGVHLGMTSNAASVLGLMLRHLTGVQGSINHINQNLGRMAVLAGGAVAAFAGFEALKGLWHLVEASKELNHELTKLQVGARLTDAQTNAAKSLAFKVGTDVRGTNVAENVKMQRELFGVFGNMDTAQQLLPMVAMGSRVTSQYTDKNTDLAQIAIRALELRGHITKDHKIDPKAFADEFNAMVRSILASEGLVDPQKLFAFIKQAGPAVRNMTGEQMWGMAPAIMNALGAERAGTATMSLFSQFVGHVVAGKRVAVAMEEAGMLTPGKWRVERGGKVRMDQDAVPDQKGFAEHPFTWLHERMEALRNRKGKDGKQIDDIDVLQRLFQFSSRATTARLISDIDANWAIIQNEERRWKQMPKPEVAFREQNQKDLSVNINNMHQAWKNFAAALGDQGVPSAIAILTRMTDALHYLTIQVNAHPDAARHIMELAAALSALMVVGGTLTVVSIALRGLVIPLRALAAVGGLATMGTGLSGVATGLGLLAGALARLSGPLGLVLGLMPKATQGPEVDYPGGMKGIRVAPPGAPLGLQGPRGFELDARDRWRRIPGSEEMPTPNVPDPRAPNGIPRTGPAFGPQSQRGSASDPLHVVVQNGRDLATGVSNHQADQMNRPASGSATPDLRQNPFMPGLPAGWIAP